MSKQWHVQQSTAEQLYEQTPDETVQLIWTDPPFGTGQLQVGSEHSYQDGTVADTLALIDHQQAVEAVQGAIPGINVLTAERALTAATPHLRAAWEQEMARAVKRLPWNGVTHGGTMVPLDAVLALLEGGGACCEHSKCPGGSICCCQEGGAE